MFATPVADVFHFLQQVHIAWIERCDADVVGRGTELLQMLRVVHNGFVVLGSVGEFLASLWSKGTAVEFFIVIVGFAVGLANGIPADHDLVAGLFGVAFFAVAAVYMYFHAVDNGLFIRLGSWGSEQEDEKSVELGHDFMPR